MQKFFDITLEDEDVEKFRTGAFPLKISGVIILRKDVLSMSNVLY
jgi:hypothetical protein